MKAMVVLKAAYRTYYDYYYPQYLKNVMSFDSYFNSLPCTFVELEVCKRRISGKRIPTNVNSRQKIDEDFHRLENTDVAANGHWLFIIRDNENEFSLINFSDENIMDKHIYELRENDKDLIAAFEVRVIEPFNYWG